MLTDNDCILPSSKYTWMAFILLNRLLIEDLCCETDNADPRDPKTARPADDLRHSTTIIGLRQGR
jgi:hypothetical protein